MPNRSATPQPMAHVFVRSINRVLRTGGVEISRVNTPSSDLVPDRLSTDLLRTEVEDRIAYGKDAAKVVERHRMQNRQQVFDLKERYSEPLFGKVRVWNLIERLAGCIDPSDERLYCASQLVHVRQILEEMESDGTATPPMILVALIHDLGKLLLLTDEDPANVVCMNSAVGEFPPGSGLDNCLLQWNHDELAFQRLQGLIPDDLAWLVRYHSIDVESTCHLMNDQDLQRTTRLLGPFAHYDHATKSPFHLPSTPLHHYRDVIEEAFPDPILF